jgi:hypothetical protein
MNLCFFFAISDLTSVQLSIFSGDSWIRELDLAVTPKLDYFRIGVFLGMLKVSFWILLELRPSVFEKDLLK